MKSDRTTLIVAFIVIAILIVAVIWATHGAVSCWIDGGIWVKPTAGLPTCVEPKQ